MATAAAELDQSVRWNWVNVIFMTLIHLAAIPAFFFVPSITDLALFVTFYLLSGFGITIGFHRLLAHRGFDCSRFQYRLWAILGTAALQGGPVWWVGLHRKHHQASDREQDPHSPRESFFHGHIGWMLKKSRLSRHMRLASDLSKDPVVYWLDKGINPVLPWLATLVICLAIGGWTGVLWGGILRTIWVWHATWCVNSVCHRWGQRPFDTRENSGNVWWVGLWALGEGWHNNHHAQPKAAIHTHHWWEIDPSAYLLWTMEKLHLIKNVVRSRAHIATAVGETVEAGE